MRHISSTCCTCPVINYGNKYKYILSEINIASKYKVAGPLRMKQVKDIAKMIVKIYKVGPLTYTKVFQCDNGGEFKAEVSKMLEKHGVMIQCPMTTYKHTHMAFLEALNSYSQSNHSRSKMHKSWMILKDVVNLG